MGRLKLKIFIDINYMCEGGICLGFSRHIYESLGFIYLLVRKSLGFNFKFKLSN